MFRLCACLPLLGFLLLVGCGKSTNKPSAGGSAKAEKPYPWGVNEAEDELVKIRDLLDADQDVPAKSLKNVMEMNPWYSGTMVFQARIARQIGHRLRSQGKIEESFSLFLKSAEVMQKAEALDPEIVTEESDLRGPLYYDAATALSLAGLTEDALGYLFLAVEAGYHDIGMFARDKHLASVQSTSDYAHFAQYALVKMRESLREQLNSFETYSLEVERIDLEGRPISLRAMRGKVVVVAFWGTWCVPCQQIMIDLADIYRDQLDQGLEIIGLAYEGIDPKEARPVIKARVDQLQIPYTCAPGSHAIGDQIPRPRDIPVTVFVDRAGLVRFQISGQQHSREYMLGLIEPLLEEE